MADISIDVSVSALTEAFIALAHRDVQLTHEAEHGERDLDRSIARHDLARVIAAKAEIHALLPCEEDLSA